MIGRLLKAIDQLADRIAYRLVKWYYSRKLKRFLPKKQYEAVMSQYDRIWGAKE